MKITGPIIRQGDVMLIPRPSSTKTCTFPNSRSKRFKHTGEGGNHMHVIDQVENMYDTETGARFVRLSEPSVLRHVALHGSTEVGHMDLPVEPGLYEPRIQREWSESDREPHMSVD